MNLIDKFNKLRPRFRSRHSSRVLKRGEVGGRESGRPSAIYVIGLTYLKHKKSMSLNRSRYIRGLMIRCQLDRPLRVGKFKMSIVVLIRNCLRFLWYSIRSCETTDGFMCRAVKEWY